MQENVLNETRQIVYSSYQSKKKKKKKKLLKNYTMMIWDTIFMNSENSKTSEPHNLVLKLTVKLDLGRGIKSITVSNLSIYYT